MELMGILGTPGAMLEERVSIRRGNRKHHRGLTTDEDKDEGRQQVRQMYSTHTLKQIGLNTRRWQPEILVHSVMS